MKGIIIVKDFPENCRDCDYFGTLCKITNKKCNWYSEDGKPEWCPIKPVPEKMKLEGKYPQKDRIPPSYKVGWNACIDEILKGESK